VARCTSVPGSAGNDEHGKGEYSCDDGAAAICPFSLFLFYRKIAEAVDVLCEHNLDIKIIQVR